MSTTLRLCAPDTLAEAAAEHVAELIRASLARSARCSVALSGGNTPRSTYGRLAAISLPWPRVDFFFADERAVAPTHVDSNYRGALESLFVPLSLPDAQIFRMEADAEDLEAAARAYDALLPERLDVIVLGLGEDGHTCSLFPGHPQLEEQVRRVVAVTESPKPPPRRLSLAPRTVLEAGARVMLATGDAKAEAVRRSLAEQGRAQETPGRLAREGTWFVDAAAAAKLKTGGQGG